MISKLRVSMERQIAGAPEQNDFIVADCIRKLIERQLQIGGNAADIDLIKILDSLIFLGRRDFQDYAIVLSKGFAQPAYTERTRWNSWLFTIDGSHEYNADIFLKEEHKFPSFPKRSAGSIAASCDTMADWKPWQHLLRKKIATVTWAFDEVVIPVQAMIDSDFTALPPSHAQIATALEALDEVVKPLRRLSNVNTEMVRFIQEEEFGPERFHRFNAWLKATSSPDQAAGDNEPLRKRRKCDMERGDWNKNDKDLLAPLDIGITSGIRLFWMRGSVSEHMHFFWLFGNILFEVKNVHCWFFGMFFFFFLHFSLHCDDSSAVACFIVFIDVDGAGIVPWQCLRLVIRELTTIWHKSCGNVQMLMAQVHWHSWWPFNV